MWSSRPCRSWARWTCGRFCMRRTSSADACRPAEWLLFAEIPFGVVLRSRPVRRLSQGPLMRGRMQNLEYGALLKNRQNLLCSVRLCALLSHLLFCVAEVFAACRIGSCACTAHAV